QTETLKHPAMAVIGRILNAEDRAPFADAHAFKRELDDSLQTVWDQAVKKHVASVTQHLRGTLRDALSVHEPYNQATAAYAKAVPLFTKGIVPRLKKLAVEEPEAIVRLINPKQPTRAKMLVDLLTTQAAAGGEDAQGRAALEGVQAAWLHEKVVKGGIETLGDRIDQLPPAFKTAFLDTPSAELALEHLRAIATAYRTAVERGAAGVEAARTTGRRTLAAAREGAAGATELAQVGVAQAKTALREGKAAGREEARRFEQSSLGRWTTRQPGTLRADALRFAILG